MGAPKVIALDAMGVLYSCGDDVSELLIPWLRERGCRLEVPQVEDLYRRASLGRLSSAEFWWRCGVDGDDVQYCSRHELTPGTLNALDALSTGHRLAVLSNDVSEWALVLRRRFGLDEYIQYWVISGDIGIRKPDPKTYQALLATVGCEAREVLFLDDRPANVAAARDLGIAAHRFTDWKDALGMVG